MSWIERHGFEMFGNFNLSQLAIDTAWLKIINHSRNNLALYALSSDCYECPFKLQRYTNPTSGRDEDLVLSPGQEAQIRIGTKFPMKYRLRETSSPRYILPKVPDNHMFCETEESELGEFGVYNLRSSGGNLCDWNVLLEPVNIYLPLLLVFFFYLALAIVCYLWQRHSSKLLNTVRKKLGLEVKSDGAETGNPPPKPRLRSLDTFRGLCIVVMIFVNDGGAGYWFFEHATWDGLYVADLVFPWFLWIMGVCIPISIKSQLKKKIPRLKAFKGILIRSLKLLGIGLMLASKGGPVNIKTFRLPGVLQRFAFSYFFSATFMLIAAEDDFVEGKAYASKVMRVVQDIVCIWKGWILALITLAGYLLLTFLVPVPGCPTGYLGPGGLHLFEEWDKYPNASECIGGASGYIDKEVLKLEHIFRFPTALGTYEASAYDPEGILGTFTSIFQVWLGIQAGMTLQTYSCHYLRLGRWFAWQLVTGAIGVALCNASMGPSGIIPVNKNLWSLSYVLITTSMALGLLILIYFVVDIKKWWNGSPFVEPGMNSILLYIGHSVGNVILPFHFQYKQVFRKTHFVRLIKSLWNTSLWVVWAIYLYRIKYFCSL